MIQKKKIIKRKKERMFSFTFANLLLFVFFLALIYVFYSNFSYIIGNPVLIEPVVAVPNSAPSGGGGAPPVVVVTFPEEKITNVSDTPALTYEPEIINQQIVNEVRTYFNIVNYDEFDVEYDKNMDWMRSYYNDGSKTIVMGLSGIENNSHFYKVVFVHEYSHYVLHQMGLTNDPLHEALADTFTWFDSKSGQEEIWGKSNEGRYWPYDIIMDKIISKDYTCLYDVYQSNNRISKISDYLIRLEDKCGVSFTGILNQI